MAENKFDKRDLTRLFRQPSDTHKGQNGRLLVIGGSKLFHASIFWTADVASRIVDLVHFSSPAMENNDLLQRKAKEKFWNGIVVPWRKVKDYVREDDCVVIGPGMPRKEGLEKGEEKTSVVVNRLFESFPEKKWVVDGGALQEMDVKLLSEKMIITPHAGEFRRLFGKKATRENAIAMSKKYGCVVVLKGVKDVVCEGADWVEISGGNEGMTKGGTGDVLAGLVGALFCKNEAFLAAASGSLINKKAGDRLYERVGPFFNASDLVNEVAVVMKEELGY
jgi:hydroxyethylthiazole kinase-like uncharacterized protein yjeF